MNEIVDPSAPPSSPPPLLPRQGSSRRGRRLGAAAASAGALLVLGAGLLAYRATFAPRSPALSTTTAPSLTPTGVKTSAEEVLVLSTRGAVEFSLDGQKFAPLAPGVKLRADAVLRTGPGGLAELSVNDKSKLTVTEGSDLTIRELSAAVHILQVKKGRLSVDYEADGTRTLQIQDEGQTSVIEAQAARFNVFSSGQSFVVATDSGLVHLRSHGQSVDVEEGNEASVRFGQAPSAPRPIPAAVLLKVANAARAKDQDVCATVEGIAEPGSVVTVDDRPVVVDGHGHFSVVVAEAKNHHDVVTATTDVLGRRRVEHIACQNRAPPAIKDLKVHWHQ